MFRLRDNLKQQHTLNSLLTPTNQPPQKLPGSSRLPRTFHISAKLVILIIKEFMFDCGIL
jgi:hypothetical protein